MATTRRMIPDSWAGTQQVCEAMARDVRASAQTEVVRDLAVSIVAGCHGVAEQLTSLRRWLDAHFTFAYDPAGVEWVMRVETMLKQLDAYDTIVGDCDDAATIAGALAAAIGCQVQFVVISLTPDGPFSHVWAEARTPDGEVVEFDLTRPAQFGHIVVERAKYVPVV